MTEKVKGPDFEPFPFENAEALALAGHKSAVRFLESWIGHSMFPSLLLWATKANGACVHCTRQTLVETYKLNDFACAVLFEMVCEPGRDYHTELTAAVQKHRDWEFSEGIKAGEQVLAESASPLEQTIVYEDEYLDDFVRGFFSVVSDKRWEIITSEQAHERRVRMMLEGLGLEPVKGADLH